MARNKTTQKSTSLSDIDLKDKIALFLSVVSVFLAGYQVYLAKKQETQNVK